MPRATLTQASLPAAFIATLITAIFLSGCGGGDSGSPAASPSNDASDKYVGTWKRCNIYNVAQGSFLAFSQTLIIAKISATSYSSLGSNSDHTDTNCTGAGTPIVGEAATTVFTIVGSKSVTPYTVDTLTYPAGGSMPAKDIAYVNPAGPTLQIGKSNSTRDADGFPTELEVVRFAKL